MLNKIIEVSGIEPRKFKEGTPDEFMKITIKDENGDKYFFYKTKKDGSESRAFNDLKTGVVKLMEKVEILYDEKKEKFTNEKGKEIEWMSRRVAMFRKPE